MVGRDVLRKEEGEVWSIKIERVRTSDQGMYICQVGNNGLYIAKT